MYNDDDDDNVAACCKSYANKYLGLSFSQIVIVVTRLCNEALRKSFNKYIYQVYMDGVQAPKI